MERSELLTIADGDEALVAEMVDVVEDLSWLDACTCGDSFDVDDFFVPPGHTIAPEVLAAAQRCPARRQEILHAYALGSSAGYVGGLSPGQRRSLRLVDALAAVDAGEL